MNGKRKIPDIGFGTYKIVGDEGVAVIKSAINMGYRMFDTAFAYENESVLGRAIQDAISEGGVSRDDLFIISKLGPYYHRAELVETGCLQSMKNLKLDYIDLYLMHSPVAQINTKQSDCMDGILTDKKANIDDEVEPLETWQALEGCYRKGFVRDIGVSNFNVDQLKKLLGKCIIRPAVNQVECSLAFLQEDMRNFCNQEQIIVMAYRPLGKPNAAEKNNSFLNSVLLKTIASKYGKSTAQIALRYLIDINTVPIPKSTNQIRMRENLDVLNFKIEYCDMEILKTLIKQNRSVSLNWLKHSKHYPF